MNFIQFLKSNSDDLVSDTRQISNGCIFVVTLNNIKFVIKSQLLQCSCIVADETLLDSIKTILQANESENSKNKENNDLLNVEYFSTDLLINLSNRSKSVDKQNPEIKATFNDATISKVIYDGNSGSKSNKDYQSYRNGKQSEDKVQLPNEQLMGEDARVKIVSIKDLNGNVGGLLSSFYNTKAVQCIAVTGTNGKTSVANFVMQLLNYLGLKTVAITTNGVFYNQQNIIHLGLTTPSVFDIHKVISIAQKQYSVQFIVMEASSHGLQQGRLDGLSITYAAFTNLSQDHLDYHGNMGNYLESKKLLFSKYLNKNGVAIINADEESRLLIKELCENNSIRCLDYGKNANDFVLTKLDFDGYKQHILIKHNKEVCATTTSILGDFQVYNILCAIGLVYEVSKYKMQEIVNFVPKLISPKGRMQRVLIDSSQTNIVVDYAHTPDGLKNALLSIKKFTKSRLIVVFGCGGDRDSSKRAKMGEVAINYADLVIVTDDNPRSEEPSKIRKAIIDGIKVVKQEQMQQLMQKTRGDALKELQSQDRSSFIEITTGRSDAICYAISIAKQDDIVLIAGKGHEDYQIIGNQKIYFSDEQTAQQCLKKILLK